MAPKRKNENLKLKSIWDETLINNILHNKKHRNRMWSWLIKHPNQSIEDIPFQSWCVKRNESDIIKNDFVRYTSKIIQQNESKRGDSIKLLIELQDGHRIETVIMKHYGHATVCVSSQIGCQMGCRFCATGTMGIIGNLTSGEILEQLVYANNITKIRNVVFMGMGEPLNNYNNLKLSVEFMTDVARMGLSYRHVTVSTVGVLTAMRRLSDELPFVNLALSLHAPNQLVRLKIVPAASAHHIDKLMEALDYHIERNKEVIKEHKYTYQKDKSRSKEEVDVYIENYNKKKVNKLTGVMIEYILIKDINDLEEHAYELANLLACRRDYILLNLIPYNPTEVAEDYEPPSSESVDRFQQICVSEPFKIHTRVRQEKGQDIAGACGQLALVNPSAVSATSVLAKPIDIEDYGNVNQLTTLRKSKVKIEINTVDIMSAQDTAANNIFKTERNNSSYYCYLNLIITLGVFIIVNNNNI